MLSLWRTLRHLQRPCIVRAEVHTAGRGSWRERLNSQVTVPPSLRDVNRPNLIQGFLQGVTVALFNPSKVSPSKEEEWAERTMRELKDREGCYELPSLSSGHDVVVTLSTSLQLWHAA